MNILIVGEGAWGMAVASAIRRDHTVHVWCADKNVAKEIATDCINSRYAPSYVVDDHIHPVVDFAHLSSIDLILVTTPVAYLETVFKHMLNWYQGQHIVLLSKGMTVEHGELPTEVCKCVLGIEADVLVGPSFAHDLFNKARTVLVHGIQNASASSAFDHLFNDYVTIAPWHDRLGLQLVAAYKNVVSIGCGMLAGKGIARNTQAIFFTRACNEMRELLIYAGADEKTFYTAAGIGDLFLTTTSTLSRNYSFGQSLGAGEAVAFVRARYPYAEGPQTLLSLHNRQKNDPWCLPIASCLYEIIYDGGDVSLLERVY
jgi:glycerol-3-phosphate dehydrogenase (NAD(P)+)